MPKVVTNIQDMSIDVASLFCDSLSTCRCRQNGLAIGPELTLTTTLLSGRCIVVSCHCHVVAFEALSSSFSKEKYETQKKISNDIMIKDSEMYLTAGGWVHHLSGWFLSCLLIVVVVVVVVVVVIGTLMRGPGCERVVRL